MRGFLFFAFAILLSTATSAPSKEQDQDQLLRLIKVSEEAAPIWMTEDEVFALIKDGRHFMDITERTYPLNLPRRPTSKAIPTTLRYPSIVLPTFPHINPARMRTFVDSFDNFHNRYYNSKHGVDSTAWLLSEIRASIAAASSYPGHVTVAPYPHQNWEQDSLICRIHGSEPSLSSELLIFGAHLDSINSRSPLTGEAPGSDDNASGSVVLLEALRVLLASRFVPQRPIELHWYAAEEVGLRGSAAIAQDYYGKRVDVVAMVNFDVVGYWVEGTPRIGFLTDHTDPALTAFLRRVTEGYLDYGWVNDACGYACSDHASWDSFGYPVASPSEHPLNPYMHTTSDSLGRMNFEQVAEFVKLTVAAAIEIGEPTVKE